MLILFARLSAKASPGIFSIYMQNALILCDPDQTRLDVKPRDNLGQNEQKNKVKMSKKPMWRVKIKKKSKA